MERTQFIVEIIASENNGLITTLGPFDDIEEAEFSASLYFLDLSNEERFYTEYQVKEI